MDHLNRLKALRDEARARIEAAKRAIDEGADGRMVASLDELIGELEGMMAFPRFPTQAPPSPLPDAAPTSAAIVPGWGAAGWGWNRALRASEEKASAKKEPTPEAFEAPAPAEEEQAGVEPPLPQAEEPSPETIAAEKPAVVEAPAPAEEEHAAIEPPLPQAEEPAPEAIAAEKPAVVATSAPAEEVHAAVEPPPPQTEEPAPEAIAAEEPPVVETSAPAEEVHAAVEPPSLQAEEPSPETVASEKSAVEPPSAHLEEPAPETVAAEKPPVVEAPKDQALEIAAVETSATDLGETFPDDIIEPILLEELLPVMEMAEALPINEALDPFDKKLLIAE